MASGWNAVVKATMEIGKGNAGGISAEGWVPTCGWGAMAATTGCGMAESLGRDTSFCKPAWSHRCQFGSCE